MSSIRHADQILVLEDGRVVGAGTHDELLADVRHVRRDRRLPARRGGGMSDDGKNGERNGEASEQTIIATTGRQARRGPFGPGGGVAVPVERSEQVRRDRPPARRRSSGPSGCAWWS